MIYRKLDDLFESYRMNGMPREMELRALVDSLLPKVSAAILSMKWQFFIAPEGNKFVTSDNPVHTFKDGVGFSKPYSELTFPISSRVVLLGTYRDVPEGYFPATSQLLKEFNRRVIANATTYAYSPNNESWVITVLNKKFHQFNLIYPAPELSTGFKV